MFDMFVSFGSVSYPTELLMSETDGRTNYLIFILRDRFAELVPCAGFIMSPVALAFWFSQPFLLPSIHAARASMRIVLLGGREGERVARPLGFSVDGYRVENVEWHPCSLSWGTVMFVPLSDLERMKRMPCCHVVMGMKPRASFN